MKKQQGFTLIELLVVIAIIGVLSAVVLASLNTARSKGNDAAVMSDLDGIRTQAQLFYGDHANSYDGLCTDGTITKQFNAADAANGATAVTTCAESTDNTAYAVAAELLTPTDTTSYCVDSTGVATTTVKSSADATAGGVCQ